MKRTVKLMLVVGLMSVVSMTTAKAENFNWTFEQVEPADEAGWGTQIEMDESGTPHAIYWSPNLHGYRYITRNDSSWERVNEFPNTHGMNMILDSQKKPHMVFTSTGVKSSFMGDNGLWSESHVANLSVGAWYYCGIFLGAENKPSVSYIDSHSRSLNYATWNESGWNSETIAGDDWFHYANSYASHTMDKSGELHFAYTGVTCPRCLVQYEC